VDELGKERTRKGHGRNIFPRFISIEEAAMSVATTIMISCEKEGAIWRYGRMLFGNRFCTGIELSEAVTKQQ